ncbi:N-acetyltransferase [Microbispora sp. GKU 823]|uniref:GNAT family N-acetyltransferase n=1 Tax=Microbispora sp. GKU 823 TaxID=1652100 RepID=UPI001C4DEB32|nr:GNAT family N-acetyltransferase [Microbispora sp. GKU 823]
MIVRIRPYQDTDRDALYDICVRTADAGHGRALMTAFLHALAAKGVPAVHLSMLTVNTRARAFYDRLGFHEIPVPDPGPVTYLGRSTEPPVT